MIRQSKPFVAVALAALMAAAPGAAYARGEGGVTQELREERGGDSGPGQGSGMTDLAIVITPTLVTADPIAPERILTVDQSGALIALLQLPATAPWRREEEPWLFGIRLIRPVCENLGSLNVIGTVRIAGTDIVIQPTATGFDPAALGQGFYLANQDNLWSLDQSSLAEGDAARVPLLGNLPVVGRLFGGCKSGLERKHSLMIMVTPSIIIMDEDQ